MKNVERKDNVEALADLYFPYMVVELLKKMPTEEKDPDGSLFQEFMDTLQTVKSAPFDTSLTEEEKVILEARLRLSLRKFGLPTKLSIALEKIKDA